MREKWERREGECRRKQKKWDTLHNKSVEILISISSRDTDVFSTQNNILFFQVKHFRFLSNINFDTSALSQTQRLKYRFLDITHNFGQYE